MKKIKALKVEKDMKVSELVEQMGECGFGAGKIAEASRIMNEMFGDEECKVFLGVAGAMVPAGMKQVILDMLDDVDVFVTTGANLTHDLIEAMGEFHYKGDEKISDEELNKKGIDRIYNVFMKNEVYEKLEDFFEENFEEFRKCKDIKGFLWKLGEILARGFVRGIDKSSTISQPSLPNNEVKTNPAHCFQGSILVKCWEKKIPIFCPALADSGIGLMIWGKKAAGKEIKVDAFEDMKEIIDIAWTSKKNGVIYVGGGIPKNFVQQSLQFSKGADYGIQITTDRTEPGGSSGAPLKEGISWGKMNPKANFVDVFCDATIGLPLIYGAVKK